jgi:hypothetical protein
VCITALVTTTRQGTPIDITVVIDGTSFLLGIVSSPDIFSQKVDVVSTYTQLCSFRNIFLADKLKKPSKRGNHPDQFWVTLTPSGSNVLH